MKYEFKNTLLAESCRGCQERGYVLISEKPIECQKCGGLGLNLSQDGLNLLTFLDTVHKNVTRNKGE